MSVMDRIEDIDPELKVVRRVRTPGGVRHFGQPIGSIIVRDWDLRIRPSRPKSKISVWDANGRREVEVIDSRHVMNEILPSVFGEPSYARRDDRTNYNPVLHGGKEPKPKGFHEGPAAYAILRQDPELVAKFGDSARWEFTGDTEPIKRVYRGVTIDEWNEAQKRGYIQSDQRGTLFEGWEGTNAGTHASTAFHYLPRNGEGVIVSIAVDDEDKWFSSDADDYLRTRERIPLDRVIANSGVFSMLNGNVQEYDERIENPAPMVTEVRMESPEARAHTGTLNKIESEWLGWDKYSDGPTFYYVGKEDGEWLLTDKNDRVVFVATTKRQAVEAMHERHAKQHGGSSTPRAGGNRSAPRTGDSANMTKVTKARADAFLEANGVKRKVPQTWTDIHITNDPKNSRILVKGRAPIGGDPNRRKWQTIERPGVRDQAAKNKFARLKMFTKDVGKLDRALKRDADSDHAAAAVLVMRKTGMRVGSAHVSVGKVETYGTTSLQKKHVSFGRGTVTFNFVGKKGVENDVTVKDAHLVSIMKQLVQDLSAEEKVFRGIRDKDTLAYLRRVTGKDYKNHDLRTYMANVIALAEVEKRRGRPKNKTEFRKWRNEVGDAVSRQLQNNRSESLASYIDPAVFTPWDQNGDFS